MPPHPTMCERTTRQRPVYRKTQESSREPKPSRASNRAQRRVRWARGDFCGGESHSPEQKSFPCSFCARKSEKISAKTGEGGSCGGASSPSTSLSKPLLTSRAARRFYASHGPSPAYKNPQNQSLAGRYISECACRSSSRCASRSPGTAARSRPSAAPSPA